MLAITTGAGTWIAPATRAVWVPAGTVYAHQAHGALELHLVGLPADTNPLGLGTPSVLAVGPLLRELILAYTVAAVAGVVFVPGPAFYGCVALTSIGLYVPFSLQVTLAQDYLPTRVGTASGIALGLTASVGGIAAPLIGHIADATSLQTAPTPLIVMPALSWLLFRTLPEPALPRPLVASPQTTGAR